MTRGITGELGKGTWPADCQLGHAVAWRGGDAGVNLQKREFPVLRFGVVTMPVDSRRRNVVPVADFERSTSRQDYRGGRSASLTN